MPLSLQTFSTVKEADAALRAAGACYVGGGTLVVRAEGELLRRMWLFPSAEGTTVGAARALLVRRVARLGLRLVSNAPLASTRHTIVNRRLEIAVYPALRASAATSAVVRWLTAKALAAAPIPTLTRRIAEAAGFLPANGRVC